MFNYLEEAKVAITSFNNRDWGVYYQTSTYACFMVQILWQQSSHFNCQFPNKECLSITSLFVDRVGSFRRENTRLSAAPLDSIWWKYG